MSLNAETAFRRFPEALREAWAALWQNDAGVYASSIAFHSLSSTFALGFLFSTILDTLGGRGEAFVARVLTYGGDLIPTEVAAFLESTLAVVRRPVPGALLPVGLVLTVWMGTNVFQAIIHALNRSYHVVETRAFWRTRLFALGYLALGLGSLIFAFLLVTVGGILDSLPPGWDGIRVGLLDFLVTFRKLLAVLVVYGGSFLVYWLAPNFRAGPRIALPGTLVFTFTWLVATVGFNLYLRHFAVYDRVYGPLATLVVSLTWVYLSSYLLMFGGEVNAAFHRLVARAEPGEAESPESD